MINLERCYLLQVLYSLLLVRTRRTCHAGIAHGRGQSTSGIHVEVTSAVLSDNGTDWV